MVFSIIVPDISSKPKNTKDAVISLLTIYWPLSLREIFYKIKKQYGYSSSYQAVYKAIKERAESEVILGKDRKYWLNVEWAKKLQSFTDIIETNYYAKERINNISGIKDSNHKGDLMILNFETIFDAEKYIYYFMKAELMKTNSDIICHMSNSEWRPIPYLRAEYNYYKKLIARKHRFYFISSGKSELEKECVNFYKSLGVNYKISNEEFVNDVFIFGDYVINIFIPEDLKRDTKKFLDKNNSLALISHVLDKKSSIRVMITRDKEISQEMKKNVLLKFK